MGNTRKAKANERGKIPPAPSLGQQAGRLKKLFGFGTLGLGGCATGLAQIVGHCDKARQRQGFGTQAGVDVQGFKASIVQHAFEVVAQGFAALTKGGLYLIGKLGFVLGGLGQGGVGNHPYHSRIDLGRRAKGFGGHV